MAANRKFILLEKQRYTPRQRFANVYHVDVFDQYAACIPDDEQIFLDLETTGLDILTCQIVCIGLAYSGGHFTVDTRDPDVLFRVLNWLWQRSGKYGAFNSNFDAGVLAAHFMRMFPGLKSYQYLDNLGADSFVMFKLLANEDKSSRKLDVAIKEVLGWPESSFNKDWLEETLENFGLSKNEMWQLMDLAHDGFMYYCSLDAEAAWQLWDYLTRFCELAGFNPRMRQFHYLYLLDIKLAIEAQIRGLSVDRDGLRQYLRELETARDLALRDFVGHPQVKPLVDHYNAVTYNNLRAKKQRSKKIWAKYGDRPWEHPEIWTKGLKNKQAKWELEHGSWFRMEYSSVPEEEWPEPRRFSPSSGSDLRWLFYGIAAKVTEQESWAGLIPWQWKKPPDPTAEDDREKYGEAEFELPSGRRITWSSTKGGALPTDQELRSLFGEPGELLNKWVKLEKRRGIIEKAVEAISGDGRIHPTKRPLATVTARSGSAGAVGMQTLPKVQRYMECLRADPGHKIIQCDFSSLENVILAEFSQDPLLHEIYCSGKPHDGYLYPAILFDGMGPQIDAVYNKDNPTKESVAAAKKQFKAQRTSWKVTTLGKAYLIGVKKLQRAQAVAGVWMTFDEARALSKSYDKAYERVEMWRQTLVPEWRQNGGWLFNGFGRPMCVPDYAEKDLVSRKIQSTGRDCLALLQFYINQIRIRDNIDMWPIVEIHDETVWQAPIHEVERAKGAFIEALAMVNRTTRWGAQLKGDVEVCDNFNAFKEGVEDDFEDMFEDFESFMESS